MFMLAKDAAPRGTAAQGIGILLVEDDALIAVATSETLRDLGYEVTGVAPSAEAALRLAAECRPDLVLMDITLQGSVDGIATAAALKARFGLPILFVTAYADGPTRARAEAIEPVGYLPKPFAPKQLEAAVAGALRTCGCTPGGRPPSWPSAPAEPLDATPASG